VVKERHAVKESLTVLLTGVGAPGTRGTLYALRHNPDGTRVKAVGTDLASGGLGRLWADAFHQVPAPETEGYVAALLAICRAESVDLVIPQTTRELAVFAGHKAAFEAESVRVMVSGQHAMAVANNKWELLKCAEQMNLPVPAHSLARSKAELIEAAVRLGYPANPVAVKPPVSNGMRGFRILREDAWDLERFLTEKPSGVEITLDQLVAMLSRGSSWPALLVTEYLPGSEYSVDVFAGSKVQIAVPRLRKAIRSGISFENELEYRDDLMQASLALGRQIGLTYAFGFQFKLDAAGVPKVLECNPRLQGTMVASLFSGVNLIWMGVQEAMGEPPERLPETLRAGSFHRFWGGVGVSGGQSDEI
jgi:carbamoyl-phosphate synthase large subunit